MSHYFIFETKFLFYRVGNAVKKRLKAIAFYSMKQNTVIIYCNTSYRRIRASIALIKGNHHAFIAHHRAFSRKIALPYLGSNSYPTKPNFA